MIPVMTADRLRLAVARVDHAVSRLAFLAAISAGVLLSLMVGHVILEITLRSAFATSTFALDEFVGYGVAAVTFLSAGYAFQDNAFIRVGLALEAARRADGMRRTLEFTCTLVTAATIWFVAWYFARSVGRHLDRGTVSETVAAVPLWIPEGLMLAGLLVLALRVTVYAVRVAVGGRLLDAEDDPARPSGAGA